MYRYLTVLIALAGSPVLAHELDGAYERVSLTNTRTGESPEATNRRVWDAFHRDERARLLGAAGTPASEETES